MELFQSLSASELKAIGLSLRVALIASLASLPFAICMAWVLARRRFRGHGLLSAITHLPLILPPVVTGYLLLIALGRNAPLGRFLEESFGLVFIFRWTGAALAAAIMAFPLMVRAIRMGFEAVDPKLEEAARSLGASPLRVFYAVTLPLIAPAILSGVIMGFAKALGEFGATITFVASIPGETQTLPSAIYTLLQVPGGEAQAARLVIIACLLAIGAVLLSEWLSRRMARKIGTK